MGSRQREEFNLTSSFRDNGRWRVVFKKNPDYWKQQVHNCCLGERLGLEMHLSLGAAEMTWEERVQR